MRELTINEPGGKVIFSLPDKCCAFCSHCSDFFYDYTNGPYLFACDIDLKPSEWETCKGFHDIEDDNTCKGCIHNRGNFPGTDDIQCGYIEDRINNDRCEYYEEDNNNGNP